MQTWLLPAVQIITALAATAVAAFVALISHRQWQISREKLRLDLFNRRFDVYLRVLDCYQGLLGARGAAKQNALSITFIQAVRESRFIFPQDSDVYQFLEEFQRYANRVLAFESTKEDRATLPMRERMDLEQSYQSNLQWIFNAMAPLEDKMAPYLRFDDF